MSDAKPREIKVVLLGDTGVGKSSLVLRFVNNTFDPYSESTIGASFMAKTIETKDREQIKLQLWDTAGQEVYKSLTRMYYRGAACAIVVYDITRRSSYEEVCKTWLDELRKELGNSIVIAIVGNKSDLEGARQVPKDEAKAFADGINAIFMECSAKTASNISALFLQIASLIPKSTVEDKSRDSILRLPDEMEDSKKGKKGKKQCC